MSQAEVIAFVVIVFGGLLLFQRWVDARKKTETTRLAHDIAGQSSEEHLRDMRRMRESAASDRRHRTRNMLVGLAINVAIVGAIVVVVSQHWY